MKKLLLSASALALMSLLFVSCNNTDDDTPDTPDVPVTPTNPVDNKNPFNFSLNGLVDQADSVVIEFMTEEDDITKGYKLISNAGSFNINLTNAELFPITDFLDEDYVGTISDKTARFNQFYIFNIYNKKKHIGGLVKGNNDHSLIYINTLKGDVFCMYMYANKDCNAKGLKKQIDDEDGSIIIGNIDLALKKGWNTLLAKTIEYNGKDAEVDITSITDISNLDWYYVDVLKLYGLTPTKPNINIATMQAILK